MTSSRLQALEWIYDRNYIHSRLDGLLGHPQIIRVHNKYGMQTTTVIPISLAQHGIRSVSHMWAYFSAAASKNYYACVYTNTLCRTRSRQ